jgi:hypothetical protein
MSNFRVFAEYSLVFRKEQESSLSLFIAVITAALPLLENMLMLPNAHTARRKDIFRLRFALASNFHTYRLSID